MKIDFSATGKGRVWAGTITGTLFCITVTFFVDSFNFSNMTDAQFQYSLKVNILLPAGLAAPMFWLLLHKMRQLAIAHQELSIIATTDS